MNQVLLNVVSNAIKYTPQKGSVLFNIKEVPAETGYAVFEFLVKDNGIGMSEDFLLQIFDPFTRVNSSTVSGIQGTGLGMSITKNIVDMMGGTIDIKSEENVGTEVLMTFKFKLHEETDLFAGIEKFNGMRCLIVDDVLSVCESVSDIFKKHGLCPDWCLSGEAALEYLERSVISENPYRLFVIDWNMPEMNGIQLSRKIRKIVGPHVPIIVLTSYDWIDIEKEALEAGVTAFYAKPLFPSDLRHLLLKFCDESLEKFTNLNSLEIKQKKFDFTGRKVMLVEDNELNREISTEILEDRGIEVTAMESGDLAVEKLKYSSAPFDLILMDIQMPGIDGYEATRQIRAMKNKEIANIPIIAMTANAFDEDKRMAMEAGMNDHVAKPVDGQFNGDVLCSALHGSSFWIDVRKTVLHHVQECALVAEAFLREQFIEMACFVERNFIFGPCLGLTDFFGGCAVLIATHSMNQKLSNVINNGCRVKFRVLADVLIHVAHVETFAGAHELAEKRITPFGNGRIVARPRAARFAEVERVVLFCTREVHGIATDKEQMLYRDNAVRDKVHERDAVDEQRSATVC